MPGSPRVTRLTRVVAGTGGASAHRFTRVTGFVVYKTPPAPTIGRYTAALQDLLPVGKAWTRVLGSNSAKLLTGLAQEFERVHSRASDLLLREMSPGTSIELLADWERNLGLPDDCAPALTSVSDRQAAAGAKWAARGSTSSASRIGEAEEIAANLEYAEVIVRRFHMLQFTCESECDDDLNSERTIFWIEFIATHKSDSLDAFCDARSFGRSCQTGTLPLRTR